MNNIEKVTTVISNMIDECLLNGVYMCKPNESINRKYFRKGK